MRTKQTLDFSKNLSAEYYNNRNWHYDNQCRDHSKKVIHGIHVPDRYLISLNITGEYNGHR